MSVLERVRITNNERLDIPDFANVENFGNADWGAFFANYMGDTAFVVKGFDITSPGSLINTAGVTISVNIASSCMFNPTSSNARGGFYVAPVDEPVQTVSLTPNATNYIELDQTTSTGAPDIRSFWDPSANGGVGGEFSQIVDTVTFLEVTVSANTVGFTTGRIPIAKIVVGALPTTLITSITDCRPMFFRLGTGGTTPDPFNDFTWPNSPAGYSRSDVPVTVNAPGGPNPFAGSDKNVRHFKDWMDAVMSRIRELDGGVYWFDNSIASVTGLAQNQNVHMLDEGVVWAWNLATETLTWDNTVTFQIPGSTNNNTMATSSAVLGAGEVAYVSIDRTAFAALTATICNDDALPIHQDNFVFARRDGNDVIVGTHSFRVKPTDATESDYSDHLAKEKILKPLITQAGADTSIWIYPSQRVSGIKRRYTYIKPKESSLFPRTAYLAGTYDGGANNDQLTEIEFVNNAGTLEVWAALPTPVPFMLASTAIVANKWTPVLIAISSADAITVTFGSNYNSLALAIEDAALPVPTATDYPVAVVVIETDGGAPVVIQPITEVHLLDRRPTGAGGSGGGGGTGTVVEYTATGLEPGGLIDFSAFIPPLSYVPGTGDLSVIENGLELFIGAARDYTETSATSITLTTIPTAGDRYKFRTGAGVTPLSIGDVVGPAGATDEAFCRFDTATGKLIQNSVVLCTNAGDVTGVKDLTMTGTLTGGSSPFTIHSVETDGGAAVGYILDTTNTLGANGSKILSLRNNSVEFLNVRKGTNLYSAAGVAITSVNDVAGTLALELSASPTAIRALMTGLTTSFGLELLDDLVWGAGYKYCAFNYNQATNPNITMTTEMNARGTVGFEMSGGQPGGAPGTAPTWWVTVTDDLGGETTTDAAIALYGEDYAECNRTDVRFSTIASGAATQGYIGIAKTGAFFGGKTLIAPSEWLFESAAVDGATAVAYRFNTENALANAAALLLSLENDGVAKLVIDKDGNITTVGTIAGYLAASLLTAKGDIITATAASTPTVVGTAGIADGWVLTKSAAAPGGLAWSAAGSGTVSGPGASTDQALVRWNGGTGTALLDSGTTLDGNDVLTHGGAVNYLRTTNADSAIALANALKATMNAHAADGAEHFAGGGPTPDVANFPVVTANATDLASLYTLCFDLFTAYEAHNLDAINAGPTYHNAQSLPGNALVSALIPTDLDEAVARLNDLKAKYNLHDADATNHTTGSLHQEVTVNSSGDCTSSSETIIGIVDTTSARAVTLSDSDKIAGRLMYIKDESGGATAMNITVTPQTGNIDGAGSVPISVDFGALRVYSDGTNWFSV